MPTHSRFESLPTELLSCILARCSRKDLVNLAQTHSNMHAVCRQELINYPFTMKITSDNLKSWLAYFVKENTLLTRGARSLNIYISIKMTKQDHLDAFDDIDSTAFDVDAQPIHPDASRILPLPSSLRKLSLRLDPMFDPDESSDILLFLLIRSLPERCPHLEELSIQARLKHSSDEFDKCIGRLTHLRKLRLHVGNLPNIPNRLSLLPASLTDLNLWTTDLQIQEEVATAVSWVRGIRNIVFVEYAPQGIANILKLLFRGGATHLTELTLYESQSNGNPAGIMSWQGALTVGLQEFSLLQPPLQTLDLTSPSAWSDSLHLPLLHTAVASTLTQLSLQWIESCIFPSHLPWPRLQSLELQDIPKMGYQGPLTEPIFPVLTDITMDKVGEIQTPGDLFPALETIKWKSPTTTPERMASLVRHDIKRIDMVVYYMGEDGLYESLWEAMGGHTIDLIVLYGRFSERIKQLADNGERIFPGFPNIREFTIEGMEDESHIP